MLQTSDVWFVNLGIAFHHLPRSVTFAGFTISIFAVLVGIGILAGFLLVRFIAGRNGGSRADCRILALSAVICGIAGARLFYVAFNWNLFRGNPARILRLSGNGMEFYGALGAGMLAVLIVCTIRDISFGTAADAAAFGLVLGQSVGEWGYFFSCESFGGYTNNYFAMRIEIDDVQPGLITKELADHIVTVGGVDYIQAHPLFLYRSMWMLALFLLLFALRHRRQWDGEIFCWYLAGYGVCRLWFEGYSAAPIVFPGTEIPAVQIIAAGTAVLALLILLWHIVHPLRPITIHVTSNDQRILHPHSLRQARKDLLKAGEKLTLREKREIRMRQAQARRALRSVYDWKKKVKKMD